MMRCYALVLFLLVGAAQAEPALSSRATDVLAQPQSDATAIVSLAENDRVEVLRRSGAWSQVKTTAGKTGWVRMMHLKSVDSAATASEASAKTSANPVNALSNLLSSGRSTNNATVTTGVRGLTKEDLQNAQANPEEFVKMQRYAVTADSAKAFARRTKLAPVQFNYLEDVTPASTPSSSPTNETAPGMSPGMGGF